MSIYAEQIGVLGNAIVEKFNLRLSPDTPIYISEGNKCHMENAHSDTYREYSDKIALILCSPDYVGVNPHDKSLEYYKNFRETIIHIKVAVRPSANNVYFARTLYEVNDLKLNNYIASGRVKQL